MATARTRRRRPQRTAAGHARAGGTPIIALAPLPGDFAGRPLLVGFSGGLDSTVLLHLLAGDPARHASGLRAIHVDHGLAPEASRWAVHCRRICDDLGVELSVVEVDVDRSSGRGLEAAARDARHRAFEAALHEGETLALAHHRDDQAETFLLRALRASGPDGLASMRPWRAFGRGGLWRPLLDTPWSALLEYASQRQLSWIEDPSNRDHGPDRNFLRARVLPLLRERWPHAAQALSRSAVLCAEASDLLAAEDARLLDALRAPSDATLDLAGLQALPPERRSRVLRAWVQHLGLPPLPARGLARIERDVLESATDGQVGFAWSGAVIRRWRDRLHADWVHADLPAAWETTWDGRAPMPLPCGGSLQLAGAQGFDAPVRLASRRGGERIVLEGRAHSHALKHVLQDAALPPWERGRLPLLWSVDGELLAAGDVALSGRMQAWLHERDARLAWSRV